jgi:hypothetical protein
MGNNPSWALGYVPSAIEWNNEWSSKADDSGPLASLIALSPSSPSYANDTEAAAGSVQVGEFYRNGNFVMIRLS